MQIFICSSATDRYMVLTCVSSDLVSQVKANVEIREGIPVSDQFLSFQCKPLNDLGSLGEYGIADEATLILNCRIRGGSEKYKSGDTSPTESSKLIKKLQQKRSRSIIEDFIRDKEKILPKEFLSVEVLKELYNAQKKLNQHKYRGKPLLEEESKILSVAISGNNKLIAYGLENGSVKVFNLEEKQEYCNFSRTHLDAVMSVSISSDSRFIVSGSRDNSIKIFDIQTRQEYHRFKDAHEGAINSIAISHDNTSIVSGSDDCSIKIFDILTKQEVHHFYAIHMDCVTSVAISNDNKLLVSGSSDKSIKVIDFQTKQEIHHFKDAATAGISSIDISCDNRLIIAASTSGSIQAFDIELKKEVHSFQDTQTSEITSVVLFGDNRFVASASTDNSIKILDLQTKQELCQFKDAHSDIINSILVSSDSRFLLSASNDKTLGIFDLQMEQEHLKFKDAFSGDITSVVISSDNKYIISGSTDKSIKIFDIDLSREFHHFKEAHAGSISTIAISCDDRFIVSGSTDSSIKVFDLQIKQEYHHFKNIHAGTVSSVAVSINNKYIISGSHDKSIKVLDIRTKRELYHFKEAHTDIISSVVVSSDDRFIVSGSTDNSIKIFDLKTKELCHWFQDAHQNGITTVALSSDNKYIVSGAGDNSITVFDFQTKQQTHQFKKAHQDGVQSLSLSSDNRFVISGSRDRSIKVFDLLNMQECYHFQNAHASYVTSVTVSKDSSLIVSGSNDRSLKVFRVSTMNDAEISYRSRNIPPNTTFAHFEDFLFTTITHENFRQLVVFYQDLQILPYYWTILHIMCIFQKSYMISQHVSYVDFKIPSLLDRYGKTPLHYLVAQDNIHYPSVNIVLTYILDYLEDKPRRDPYEVEMVFKFLTPLFQFILSKTNSVVRDRYLKAIFVSPYSHEELPSFGLPVVQKTFAKSSIVDSTVINKIHSEGNEQVMFRTIYLYLDYSPKHEDMYNIVRTLFYLKNEEVFKFPVISHIINHLWDETKLSMLGGALLFSGYMIFFSVYIGLGERRLWMEIISLLFAIFCLISEFFQMWSIGKRYGELLWSWFDLAQGFVTLPFLILRLTNQGDTLASQWLGSISLILGYIRWATFLRIFKPIRNLIQVIVSIVHDIAGFILFVVFIIVGFSLVSLQFDRENNYSDHLYTTYEMLFAIYDDNGESDSQKIVAAMVLFLFNVVFLNLLISIMGDSYDKVQERRLLTDSMTRLEMLLENMTYDQIFLKRKTEEKGFLMYCLPDRGDEDEEMQTNEWDGRINLIKKILKQNEQKVVEIIEKKMDTTEKEIDIVQKKVDKIADEMDNKINMLEKKMEQEISQVKLLVENNHQEMLRTIKQLLASD